MIDQSVVLGVLEGSVGNNQDPNPTLTAIIRSVTPLPPPPPYGEEEVMVPNIIQAWYLLLSSR